MSIEHIHSFPPFLNKLLPLVVNDQEIKARISASEWTDYWRPFLGRLYEMFVATRPKRFLIGIGGPPGSGKSVLAEQLQWIIAHGHFHNGARSCAVPMDGFHYPNYYLQNHTRKMPDGTEVPLSAVKGAPDTIDVKGFREHLEQLLARPESMPWPGYSRFAHDVIPNRHHIEKAVNMVIVEGNYVLVDRGPFAGIPKAFDLKVYVEAPGPKVVANLVERHMRGGKTVEQAKDWVRRIDLPNARIAESTKSAADVVFLRDAGQDLSGMIWRGETPPPAEGAAPAQG